jgi:hypothetical protein
MRIIVNHLTRMQPGYICVAGVDPRTGEHVRPVQLGRLSRALLVRYGGPFDIATLVDLGRVAHVGAPPKIEDYRFSVDETRLHTVTAPGDFWNLLHFTAQRHLADIFGADLRRHGGTCALPLGHGRASLGCLMPTGQPELAVSDVGTVRLHFSDGVFDVRAAVTDIRLYEANQQTLKREVVDDINGRIRRGVAVILSVGLGHPWRKPDDTEERHWLQVNGIHLADNPVWQDY